MGDIGGKSEYVHDVSQMYCILLPIHLHTSVSSAVIAVASAAEATAIAILRIHTLTQLVIHMFCMNKESLQTRSLESWRSSHALELDHIKGKSPPTRYPGVGGRWGVRRH